MCVHGTPGWTGVPTALYFQLTLSVPGIGPVSKATLIRIKKGLKVVPRAKSEIFHINPQECALN